MQHRVRESLFRSFALVLAVAAIAADPAGSSSGGEAPERLPIPDQLVVLTFDDSNKSDISIVTPILEKHGFGATFYFTRGLGAATDEEHFLTWEEAAELDQRGFEIGNHTHNHRGVKGLSQADLRKEIRVIQSECERRGISRPTTFCFPGFGHTAEAVAVLAEEGFLFARRGVRPEFPDGGHGARGPLYEPAVDHPLLIPTTGYAGPEWGFDDLKWAVRQARDGKIAVLCFHGVPAHLHPWVNCTPADFARYMQFLDDGGYQCIAVRDLVKYVDPQRRPADPYAPIQARVEALTAVPTQSTQAIADDGNSRYVIIHADDAGMSHSANRGTIDAMQNGVVSSASIMVPCPWFVEFATYARENPQGDYGIHLTLNSEWRDYRWGPVLPAAEVPSLVDEHGYLWNGTQQVALNAKAEHVEAELRAQIDRAKQFGIPLSHLDTHMGALLVRPDLIEIYVRLGVEYDLPVLFLREFDVPAAKFFPALAAKGREMLPLLEAQQLPILDRVVQYYDNRPHDERRAAYLEAFRDVPPGVTEVIIHCGYDDEELRAVTGSAAMRDSDRRMFTDPQIRVEIERLGVKVIDWKKFRAMAAGKEH